MSDHNLRRTADQRPPSVARQRPPLLARLYLRQLTARAKTRALVEAASDGVWLGLLDRRALAAVDEAYYESARETVADDKARYHDRAHITQGLHPWERAMAARFPPGARVVVTSAGAGREVFALTELGFDVVGFEPNPQLLEAGRRVLPDPSALRPSRRDEFPAAAPPADVVVIGWGSYMLVRGKAARTALLRGATAAIPVGGLVLVSFFVRPPVRYFSVAHIVARLVHRLTRRRRGEAPELGDALSPNYVHYFTRDEIVGEAADVGLHLVEYHSQPYGHALFTRTR